MLPESTDVFISGAGPVGLLLALQLRRRGVSVCIVDAADKASPEMPMYGRACTLHARTLELLDQLDLFDDLAQEALLTAKTYNYHCGEMTRSPWGALFSGIANETFLNLGLNLRLKFSEDIFRMKLAELDCHVQAPIRLVNFKIDGEATSPYPVSINCEDSNGEPTVTKAKYIIGADGGGSSVRKIAQIPFQGHSTQQKWVRIDGIVNTDLPEARLGYGNFRTETHGETLFAALDHGATRIGYIVSKKMEEKYGDHMTQEQVIHEAQMAVAPFKLEFERVDWFTVYGIQQFLADRFFDRGRILLAGDAGHTHSSGSALGMNTGVSDAVNLAWKLAGVLNGWFTSEILQNYSDERHAIAQKLINDDKISSKLISGEKPEDLKHRTESPSDLLTEFYKNSVEFLTGLGVSYKANLLNDIDHSISYMSATPGYRLPDVLVRKPGIRYARVRLYEVAKNNGKLQILVFAGNPSLTRSKLRTLRAQIDEHGQYFAHAVDYVTIIEGFGQAVDEYLGIPKFGRAYWDNDSSAHGKFSLGEHMGGIVVVRPDSIVGIAAPLDGFSKSIVPYLDRFVIRREPKKKNTGVNGNYGSLINPFESNLVNGKS